jgi:hypothetical protein
MSCANPLWGAPRIHGELLKLGFEVAQSTVARYMCRRWRPPSQGWRTFLRNHSSGIAAVDLFVLPTIAFQILYCLVILRHGRPLWVSFGVTANPTAERPPQLPSWVTTSHDSMSALGLFHPCEQTLAPQRPDEAACSALSGT